MWLNDVVDVRQRRSSTDGQLLRRAARDGAAFGEFYDRYEVVVAGYLMRRSGDRDLAADLTAETFATAFVHAHRFADDGQPAVGWLLGIARHLLLRSWERGRAERRALERLGVERIALTDASLERVEALFDARASENPLMRALERLPAAQREAVRAYVLQERPYEEISAELGVPEATIRQRVSRGLTRLRLTAERGVR